MICKRRGKSEDESIISGINSRFTHSNLAIRYLKAFTEDLNYDCLIREFSINDRVERIVEEIIEKKQI